MKRKALSAVILLLLTVSAAMAGAPPAIWFQDNFDSYTAATPGVPAKLANNGIPNWAESLVIEPGMAGPIGSGTTDVNVSSGAFACSAPNFVVMTSYQRNWNTEGNMFLSNPKGVAAETKRAAPPAGVGWDAQSAGNLQIMSFKMREAYPENPAPPLHAGIYLIDSDLFNPQPILGWVMSCKQIRPQLTLPTNLAPSWTTNRYFNVAEGSIYPLPANGLCKEFTATYDPATGVAKFYVDAVSLTTPLWTGNAGTGRASRSLYIRDYGYTFGDGTNTVDVVGFDDVAIGTTARPVLVSPLGGAFVNTATPTITWNHAVTSPLPTKHRVRVCTVDNADGTGGSIAYDSGEVTSTGNTQLTTALPTCTHLWAFVNELNGVWTGYSLAGSGGFYVTTVAPSTPTVTYPSGTVIGAKPSVIFTDTCYNAFEVKITTASDGSGIVWSISVPNSLKSGASCTQMLTPGTQYYAFAKATNAAGSSAWSAASPFMVTRAGEGTDFRGMEETWGSQSVLDHNAAAPDDGFNEYCGGGRTWADIKRQVLPDPFNATLDSNGVPANYLPCDWWPNSGPVAYDPGWWIIPPDPNRGSGANSSYIADFWDTQATWASNDIRLHRVSNIDLDKGVTFMTLAAGKCYEGVNCGSPSARQVAQEAQIYIMDDYGTSKCMASFRYGQGSVGICSNAQTWALGGYTDTQVPDRPGQGWHLVRITGRNAIVGDPTSTVWRYYLDENPSPLVTATGSIDQAIAPYGAIVDGIAIGQGDGGLVGNWQYDWTGVNTSGDYGPGEWFGGGSGPAYATISEARAANLPGPCTITGDAVITGVMTDQIGNQIGFSVQDVNTQDHAGMYIESTISANVLEGNKVNGIGGVLTMQPGVGATMQSAAFTATTDTAGALPLAMSQKSLQGYKTPPAAGLQNAGMYVRVCGRVTAWLPDAVGIPVIYLDDGSGLVDGRTVYGNPSALGLRIVTNQFFDGSGAVGKYYRVDGICTCETWTEGATTKTVETILAPRLEEIPEP